MKDELKNIISQSMNTNSQDQESIEQFAEGELSDTALDSVAGGVCVRYTKDPKYPCIGWTFFYNANK
jgi:hypothetical protein